MRENYQNSHLFNPFSSEKSPTGAFFARLGYIYHHLIDIHAKHASAAILVTTLLIARLICGHTAWTLLVQDFNVKTDRYQIPRVHTRPSMPWVHVRAPGATRRSYRRVFGSAVIFAYSPVCGGAIEVARTARVMRQQAKKGHETSYGSYWSC
jgi:hypothetical protein